MASVVASVPRGPAASLLAGLLAGLLPGAVAAQPAGDPTLPATPEQRQTAPVRDVAPARGPGLWARGTLLGEPGGLRSRLDARGLALRLSETSNVMGNPTGGQRATTAYAGVTQFGVTVDTGLAFGLPGGTVTASGYQIHGRSLSADALGGNLHTVSNVEEARGTLLAELWYEQALFGGKASLRIGQVLADDEFLASAYAGLFVNSTFGWPAYASLTLPNGGSHYPRAALGARLRVQLADGWTMLAGVFNGDPSGPARQDGRSRNPYGASFRIGGGVLAFAELHYTRHSNDSVIRYPGTYKLGLWLHSARFADPGAAGATRTRRGNWSLYAIADQLVWPEGDTKDQGIGVFARVMAGPGDRNLVDAYVDAGVSYKGLLPGRDNDTLGLAVGFSRFSDGVSKADSEASRAGPLRPVRRGETVLELTYQASVAPWWQVQPVAQYIVHPSGLGDPMRPGQRLPNALVLGVQSNLTF